MYETNQQTCEIKPQTVGYMQVVPRTQGACPNCGYCPCCGRPRPAQPYEYPFGYPNNPYPGTWTLGGAIQGGDLNTAQALGGTVAINNGLATGIHGTAVRD